MKIRTRLTKDERRRRLLDAATELFGRNGYSDTEVKDLAKQAGVTKPILYRHFPGGKSEVFMAVLDTHIESLLRSLWEAMSSATEPRERLRQGLRAYVSFAEGDPQAFGLLANPAPDLESGVGVRLREARDIIARGVASTIADVMKGAGLSPEGAPIYAYGLLGGVESVTAWWLENKSINRSTLIDFLLAYVWRGFDGLPRDPTKRHRVT